MCWLFFPGKTYPIMKKKKCFCDRDFFSESRYPPQNRQSRSVSFNSSIDETEIEEEIRVMSAKETDTVVLDFLLDYN